MKQINSFTGAYRYLSNFYPCKIEFEGAVYPSAEHAFVAAKTEDEHVRELILKVDTASKVKRMGRKLELRRNWESVKVFYMRKIVQAKFDQNPDLMQKLKGTAPAELIEGNFWGDTFWGQCPVGTGQNVLGKILMEVRGDLSTSKFFK